MDGQAFNHYFREFGASAGPGSLNVLRGFDSDGAATDDLPSIYPVTDFACAAVAGAARAAHRLAKKLGLETNDAVLVDRRLTSIWFNSTVDPRGWELPSLWDAVAGNYRCGGRFVRLHTNAPAHRDAALGVLGCEADRDAVATAVAGWDPFELHDAVVNAGGVAAALRTRNEWLEHPHGAALQTETLVLHEKFTRPAAPLPRSGDGRPDRPLDGVRVLDLTRVLAGPVATRFLAGLGADVLRIDPLDWNEPGTVPEVNLGKRCARLDLRSNADRATFDELLASTDIVVHGYRPGALDGLGYDADRRRADNPELVDVSLNAWGYSGPWADRRGFDSIVQVAGGIAAAGMEAYGTEVPKPLPVQALDHAAGYTLARCAIDGWTDRVTMGAGSRWRTSLAAHAELLCSAGATGDQDAAFPAMATGDLELAIEQTSWGQARRARAPVHLPGVDLRWNLGASNHGTSPAAWL